MDPERVAVFHHNQIGDLLFALPALLAMREQWREARMVSVAPPAPASLLQGSSLVDGVISAGEGAKGARATLGEVRREKPTLAVCFSQSRRTMILAWLSGARRRVGFTGGPLERLLTERVPKEGSPSLAHNLRLVESLGCAATQRDYVGLLTVTDAERADAARLFSEHRINSNRPLAILAPGASGKRTIKEWTPASFASVADHLAAQGMQVVLVGTSPADDILQRATSSIVDLSGRTRLRQLLGVLERAQLFVGIDSGVMHLAAALGVPTVGVFGPTDPQRTGPMGARAVIVRRDLPCSPCLAAVCPLGTRECLEQLQPSAVKAAIADLIRNPQSAMSHHAQPL